MAAVKKAKRKRGNPNLKKGVRPTDKSGKLSDGSLLLHAGYDPVIAMASFRVPSVGSR
jgi:hypothetical protein